MYRFERYHRARVERVVDGDTVILSFYLGLGIWLNDQSVRLVGINAPEMTGEEKPRGIAVKAFLEKLMADSTEIIARTDEKAKGKYGRFLVTLLAKANGKWHNVNDLLLQRGAAKEYMASGVLRDTPAEEHREIFDTPAADIENRLVVDEKRTEEEVYNQEDSDMKTAMLRLAKELVSRGPTEIDKVSDMEKLTGPITLTDEGEENLYFSDGDGKKYFFKYDGRERDVRRIRRYFSSIKMARELVAEPYQLGSKL